MATIGFIGLGRMGRPMAGNMQQKGFSLLVYDIVEEPVKALVALGAGAAPSIAELAAGLEIDPAAEYCVSCAGDIETGSSGT